MAIHVLMACLKVRVIIFSKMQIATAEASLQF